jgi:tubulin-specific chaperone E
VTRDQEPISSGTQIEISGKIVEEVGFDKIRRKLAQVSDLKIVILDGMLIAVPFAGDEVSIKETCPKITELDLSRNLFDRIDVVVDICRELEALRSLRLK